MGTETMKEVRMSNRHKERLFGRAWRDTEFDDEGELLVDAWPGRCSRCHRATDVGSLDDSDVFQCGFCRGRTRYLWSDRRGTPVPDLPGLQPDWREGAWRDSWFMGDEWEWSTWEDYWEEPDYCYQCDGPDDGEDGELTSRSRPLFREGCRWFCPRCCEEITGEYDEY